MGRKELFLFSHQLVLGLRTAHQPVIEDFPGCIRRRYDYLVLSCLGLSSKLLSSTAKLYSRVCHQRTLNTSYCLLLIDYERVIIDQLKRILD